jgi:leader peptidase (prepilin peptidase)/N-methyltransferase
LTPGRPGPIIRSSPPALSPEGIPTVDQAAADSLRTFFVAWSALLGAVVGSFLNVVVARVPAGLSVVRPRSRCPRCERPIAWYDNLPVLSWLLLRARCRHCRLPISARYPLVEALVAGLAAWVALRHGPTAAAAVELALVALVVALAFIDLDTWLLPWSLTLPLAALALLGGAARLTPAGSLGAAALGGALGFGLFLLVHVVGEKVLKKEAMGFGDVVLLGGLGAWLGPLGLLPVILLSSLQGALVGVALLLLGKGEPGPPETSTEPSTSSAGSISARPERSAPSEVEGPESRGPPADDEAWVPPRHAIPYGPFLVLAALEWLLLARPLASLVPAFELFLGR